MRNKREGQVAARNTSAIVCSPRRRPDPAALADTVAHLAGRGDLAGGLFAVALVAHGSEFGWKTPWRDLLTALRRHPDADVREAAYTLGMS